MSALILRGKLVSLICKTTIPSARYATKAAPVVPIKMSSDLYENPKTTNPLAAPLIIMHGLFGSKQNWRGVGKAIAAKTVRKIFTIDARNHGESPHTTVHNSAGMSADVVDFMQTHNMSKACLMGHSMGGRTMMYCALKYPQLVDRLIVVDISPIAIPRDFYEMKLIFDAMLNMNVPSDVPMTEGRKLVKAQLKQAVDSNETVEFIMLNLRKHANTGEYYWAANVRVLRDGIGEFDKFNSHIVDLPPYRGPTTFICGNKSNFVRPDHWPQIQKHFPNAELHWLDAGHLVHFEQPQQFIQLVADFLNRSNA